jgi:hypothetical protein
MFSQITPVVLTYNEAPNIKRTLDHLTWASRINCTWEAIATQLIDVYEEILGVGLPGCSPYRPTCPSRTKD